VAQPATFDKDFLEALNPDSLKVVTAYLEPSLARAKGDEKFSSSGTVNSVADRKEHGEGKSVFNRVAGRRIVGLTCPLPPYQFKGRKSGVERLIDLAVG
jgi:hypothetical protein